jgi:hypothetical protein
MTEIEIEHGIKSAYYSNCGLKAVLECLCGETFDGGTPSWEDAGVEMDRHLNEVE